MPDFADVGTFEAKHVAAGCFVLVARSPACNADLRICRSSTPVKLRLAILAFVSRGHARALGRWRDWHICKRSSSNCANRFTRPRVFNVEFWTSTPFIAEARASKTMLHVTLSLDVVTRMLSPMSTLIECSYILLSDLHTL